MLAKTAAREREVWRFLRFGCLLAALLSTVAAVTDFFVGLNPWWYAVLAVVNLAGACGSEHMIRRLDREAVLALPEVQAMLAALQQISENVTVALMPPMMAITAAIQDMIPAVMAMADVFKPVLRAQYPPGTVQNPADPSPRPRSRGTVHTDPETGEKIDHAFIERFGSRFPR